MQRRNLFLLFVCVIALLTSVLVLPQFPALAQESTTPTPNETPTTNPPPDASPTALAPVAPSPAPAFSPNESPLSAVQDYLLYLAIGVAIVVLAWLSVFLLGRRTRVQASALAYLKSAQLRSLVVPIEKDSVTIGRDKDCDAQITEKMGLPQAETISRKHARLERRGDRWVLIDGVVTNQPSANGVYVAGVRTRENYLHDGVEISFGLVRFTFHVQPSPSNLSLGGAR